jgi:hypothetical protein
MERYFQRKEATERCDEDRARQLQAEIDDQWISRFLANDLVGCDTIMEPFAREILAQLAETGEPIPLILDQTTASHYRILMLSVRWGERSAAGLAGRGNRGRHRLRHATGIARGGRRLAACGSGRGSAR